MKDCEPLKGKERIWYEYGEHTNHETVETKCFDKSDVVSAVRFYKRYKDKPSKLYKEDRDAFELHAHRESIETIYKFIDFYNRWLFDYCFADVI